MDLVTYIVLSISYIVMMPLMLSTEHDFHLVEIIPLFAAGGLIGWAMDSYLTGFIFSVIMHFVFWNHGED